MLKVYMPGAPVMQSISLPCTHCATLSNAPCPSTCHPPATCSHHHHDHPTFHLLTPSLAPSAEINRTSACRDPEASVVVTVTDSCPCYYPSNAYSNKRWCCGDMPHFDLSAWAFEKLADPKNGVIPLQYRKVRGR